MRHSALTLTVAMLAVSLLPPEQGAASKRARHEPGELLWEDRFDLSRFEQAFSSAAGRGRVFVAGFASAVDLSRDFVVRAYDANTGALLWDDRVDRGGDEFALAVTTDGHTVWVSGNAGQDWLVRAYEAASGLLLWQDVFDRAGGFDAVQNRALLFNKGLLHVGGSGTIPGALRVDAPGVAIPMRGPMVFQPWSRPMTPPVSAAMVEAASVAQPDGDSRGDLGCRIGSDSGQNPFPPGSLTGATLVVGRGICDVSQKAANAAQAGAIAVVVVMLPGQQPFEFLGEIVPIPVVAVSHEPVTDLRQLIAAGTRVVVTLSDEFAGGVKGIVRTYDAASGVVVWQDEFDRGGHAGHQARSFASNGGRLFVTGLSSSPIADEVVLRAYDASTGALQWEHYTPGILGVGYTFGMAVAAQGHRVFVGSSIETTTGIMFVVQAHDAQTGERLWQDSPNNKGDNLLSDLAVDGANVVALGFGGRRCAPSPSSNCNVIVRSYHSANGALRWHREFDLSGLDDQAADIEIAHGTVYFSAIGAYLSADGGNWHIRALDGATGDIRWDSRGGVLELPQDLTLDKNRLIVPGRSVDPGTGDWDIIVRTYNAQPSR